MAKRKKKSIEEWTKELEGLVKAEKWEELLDAAETFIKEHPEEAVGYFYKGYAEDAIGNVDAAIQNYNRAIKLNSTIAPIYQNRGNAYARLKELDKAIQDFREAERLYRSAIRKNDEDAFSAINLIEVRTSISVAETEKKYIQQIEELNESYERYNPAKIAEHYQDEIDKIEVQLYGETTENNNSINGQTSKKDTKTTSKWLENVSPLFSLILIAGLVVFITEPSSRSSLFFSILLGAGLAKIYIEFELLRWAGFGLIIRSRLIASNLRIVSIVVFAVMTQIYFGIFDLGMKPIGDPNNFFSLLRYTASIIFIIAPFILYYRHVQSRFNQLQILSLALHRECRNILFWIAQSSENENSPKIQLSKQILHHINKNGAADIAVKMMGRKRSGANEGRGDEGRLSFMESTLQDIKSQLDVIKGQQKGGD